MAIHDDLLLEAWIDPGNPGNPDNPGNNVKRKKFMHLFCVCFYAYNNLDSE